MRKLLLTGAVCAVLLPGTAHAAVTTRTGTTCGLVGVIQQGSDHVDLVIAATVVGVDTVHVDGNPMAAYVECRFYRNGVGPDPVFRPVAVPGAAAVATTTGFPLRVTDNVTVCTYRRTSNVYGSSSTTSCADAANTTLLGQTLFTIVPQPYVD
jgi:hypothetical protein